MTAQDKKDDEAFDRTVAQIKTRNPGPFRRQYILGQIEIYGGDEAAVLGRNEQKFAAALADLISSHTPAGAEDYMKKLFDKLTGRD